MGCKIVDWNEQVPVRVIVKWVLKKWGVRLWTGFSRFQRGSSNWLLSGFHKTLEVFDHSNDYRHLKMDSVACCWADGRATYSMFPFKFKIPVFSSGKCVVTICGGKSPQTPTHQIDVTCLV